LRTAQAEGDRREGERKMQRQEPAARQPPPLSVLNRCGIF
jgi:hypothetical protein